MPSVRATVWLPEELWKAVQRLASDEGDANPVVLRAVEEYVLRSHRRRTRTRPAKYKKLVKALSTPVSGLNLSARAAACLAQLHVRSVCELVALKIPVSAVRFCPAHHSFQA